MRYHYLRQFGATAPLGHLELYVDSHVERQQQVEHFVEGGHALPGKGVAKPAADVELACGGEVELRQGALAVGAALEGGVVPDHRRAVTQQLDVELHPLAACFMGGPHGG